MFESWAGQELAILQGALLLPLLLRPQALRWRCAMLVLPLYLLGAGLSLLLAAPAAAGALFIVSPTRLALLGLIVLIGGVVLRYASSNLRDDRDERRFLNWYLATLCAVCGTISSNQLPLLLLGWTAISLCLHRLLLFYPERPRAALAARKKFLFARLSEGLLLLAFVLLYRQHGTLGIDAILQHYETMPLLAPGEQWAALLLALVALIKCAQLPFHGWLIQVVEAPTPVSALLHAGIVNLGGFLLILFAPLLQLAVPAQWLLLLVAGPGCVLAALIMATRISIKVSLAWSTVAQMGLMLLECALGLTELALLHLLAHSCYKALAFLEAGTTPDRHLRRAVTGATLPGRRQWLLAGALTLALLAPVWWLGPERHSLAAVLLTGIGLASLLAAGASLPSWQLRLRPLALAAAGLGLYLLLTRCTTLLVPAPQRELALLQDLWVALLFAALFALHLCLQYLPRQPWVQRLFITLNAGCYLDEWATRCTLGVWPLRASPRLLPAEGALP